MNKKEIDKLLLENEIAEVIKNNAATPEQPKGLEVVADGMQLVPDWHGYALLGTGRYLLNASPPPMDPELGAEFCITLATEEDRSDNRQIGELRDNTRTTPYQPEEIAIRIGFLTPQALDAMEAQLAILRKDHWPETVTTHAEQVRAETIEECAKLAVEWGNARLDDHGGHALRNYAAAIRALGEKK